MADLLPESNISSINTKVITLIKGVSKQHLQIAIAFFAFSLIGLNDGALGVVIPGIMLEYNLDKTTIGWLFLTRTIGYIIVAFTGGILLEKIGFRWFVILGASMFFLESIILILKLPLGVVLIGFLALGCGGIIFETGLNSFIAKLPNNAVFLNYLHGCYGIGALLSPAIVSILLSQHLSWNSFYVILLIASLFSMISFGFIFSKVDILVQDHKELAKSNILIDTIKTKLIWLAAIFFLIYVGIELSIGNWSYSFLTEEREFAVLLSGWIVSGYWMGLTLSRLSLAKIVGWLGSQRLVQLCITGIILGMLLVWLTPNLIINAIGLWLAGFSLGPIYPTTIALISCLVPARILPSAIGFIASGDSIGATLLPWLAGYLAKQFGFSSLMPYVITFCIVMLVLWPYLVHSKDDL
ncbi:MAG: MFS transporter [Microcystaceae cyanobacterium]